MTVCRVVASVDQMPDTAAAEIVDDPTREPDRLACRLPRFAEVADRSPVPVEHGRAIEAAHRKPPLDDRSELASIHGSTRGRSFLLCSGRRRTMSVGPVVVAPFEGASFAHTPGREEQEQHEVGEVGSEMRAQGDSTSSREKKPAGPGSGRGRLRDVGLHAELVSADGEREALESKASSMTDARVRCRFALPG